jgi:hypothetical protein
LVWILCFIVVVLMIPKWESKALMPIKNFVVYFLLIVAYLAGFMKSAKRNLFTTQILPFSASLFGCGFHGHNGLDPESLLHIFNTYITPVLLYGMELLLPSSKPLELVSSLLFWWYLNE